MRFLKKIICTKYKAALESLLTSCCSITTETRIERKWRTRKKVGKLLPKRNVASSCSFQRVTSILILLCLETSVMLWLVYTQYWTSSILSSAIGILQSNPHIHHSTTGSFRSLISFPGTTPNMSLYCLLDVLLGSCQLPVRFLFHQLAAYAYLVLNK